MYSNPQNSTMQLTYSSTGFALLLLAFTIAVAASPTVRPFIRSRYSLRWQTVASTDKTTMPTNGTLGETSETAVESQSTTGLPQMEEKLTIADSSGGVTTSHKPDIVTRSVLEDVLFSFTPGRNASNVSAEYDYYDNK